MNASRFASINCLALTDFPARYLLVWNFLIYQQMLKIHDIIWDEGKVESDNLHIHVISFKYEKICVRFVAR